MSALTDLFTALANKIRSKTGGQETYTPLEMVSDGIDDVYDAGVIAGTPTLTGDASASDVKSGKTFYGSTLTKQTGTFEADSTNNSATATTSQETKSPASGKYFANFTINPQQHSETYTPAANTSNNDMGAVHNKRYVNTSGMIVPSGNKAITANGTGIDVSSYSTCSVAVPDPTLSGDAAVGNVLSGKTFYNNSLTKRTGTMTNNGAVAPSGLNCGGSYTIPAGYHNGSGVVTANSLASQTGVDSGKTAVTAAKMFSGYQGWVNGSKISGTYTAPILVQLQPSNTEHPSLSVNDNYTIKTNSGYAIQSYADDNLTPSADGNQFLQGWNYMTTGGYAYSAKPEGTETTLWTNPSPTGTFSPQTITLSQSIRNFDFIKIKYLMSRAKTPLVYGTLLMPVDEFVTTADVDGALMIGITGRGGNFPLTRPTIYASDTSIQFLAANRVGGNSTSTDVDIPQEIIGVKSPLRPESGFIETNLWTNSSPTSNFSDNTTITLSESMANFDFIKIIYKGRTDSSTGNFDSIMPSAQVINIGAGTTASQFIWTIGGATTNGSGVVARGITCPSATQLKFTTSKLLGGTTTSAANTIPLYVKGLKFKS